jgi:hypothetical protein
LNILVITSSPIEVNTSAMISNVALMKGFVQLGHQVHLLTFQPYAYMGNENQFDLEGIKVIRLENNKAYRALVAEDQSATFKQTVKKGLLNLARKVYHSVSLYDNFKKAIPNVSAFQPVEYYDLVISCSDPKSSHLLAKRFVKLYPTYYGKWIQFWGDPMTIDITRKSKLPTVFVKQVEKSIIRASDAVVYVSPMTLEAQQKMFPNFVRKLHFIPLAYTEAKRYRKSVKREVAKVGYFGSYPSKFRDIFPLYNAAKELPIELNIVGDSDLILPPTNTIKLESRISFRKVEEYEGDTDILVCICNRIGTQIPGKLYYYAGTDKPILIILDGEADRLRAYLEKFERFEFCNNSVDEIKQAIQRMLQMPKAYLPQPDFSPKAVANQFIQCVE